MQMNVRIPDLAERELARATTAYLHEVKGRRNSTAGKKALFEVQTAVQTATMDLYLRELEGEDVSVLRMKRDWLAKRI